MVISSRLASARISLRSFLISSSVGIPSTAAAPFLGGFFNGSSSSSETLSSASSSSSLLASLRVFFAGGAARFFFWGVDLGVTVLRGFLSFCGWKNRNQPNISWKRFAFTYFTIFRVRSFFWLFIFWWFVFAFCVLFSFFRTSSSRSASFWRRTTSRCFPFFGWHDFILAEIFFGLLRLFRLAVSATLSSGAAASRSASWCVSRWFTTVGFGIWSSSRRIVLETIMKC